MNQYWNKLHNKYTKEEWIDKPSLFAQWAIKYFPKTGQIIDIGGGQGQDSRFFAEHGYDVTLIDISEKGLKYAQRKIPANLKNKITIKKMDISQLLPLPNKSFDITYAHLTLHYFNQVTTKKIFDEIYRILKPNGLFALLGNSTKDPEYKTGIKIESNLYKIDNIEKRYFSVGNIRPFIKKFDIIVLDDAGETYKDRAIGVENLIRFIGKKPFSIK